MSANNKADEDGCLCFSAQKAVSGSCSYPKAVFGDFSRFSLVKPWTVLYTKRLFQKSKALSAEYTSLDLD
jgi:hypothetical protein